MILVSQVTEKMIAYSHGNLHDINHFIKVWGYAKTIGELENLDENMQFILEIAAVIHDIACPVCREKYENTNGKLQESEGPPLVYAFLQDMGLAETQIQRIAFLVGHHHTYTGVDGPDYQILLEADYLVNSDEGQYSIENIIDTCNRIFRTKSGINLLKSMYALA